MSNMKLYVDTDEHGNITKYLRTRQENVEGFQVRLEDRSEIQKVVQNPSIHMIRDGKVFEKPKVQIVLEKNMVIIGGEDTVRVNVLGLQEGVESVRLRVGNQVVTLKRGEDLLIASETQGVVGIRLEDHRFQADDKTLMTSARF